ncbi:MAG: SUMF1/EgtB/PvdO family nonheme iron enzyme [Desulfobacterales bacterium]|nr:SUMF1/EgtB/PvdO family nonheme iron enzyme [Desulfobacterales bacterium]
MAQLLLPGQIKPSAWQKTKQVLSALFQPTVYLASKNAETQTRNTSFMVASNQAIAERRDELQKAQLQMQYMQFKERETNLAEMERLRRELRENEGNENRRLQEKLARLSRENNTDLAKFKANIDLIIQEESQRFQAEQADLNRRFQAHLAESNQERQKELTEFRAKVDMAIQEKNLDFQRWSLEQQKELQLQLKSADTELARELRAYDRETSVKIIEEKKKIDNSPIWLVADQIVGASLEKEPVPLRIFLSPPVLPYDRHVRPEGTKAFPEMADYLAESLRQFFSNYSAQGRNTDFLYGAWISNFFHGEAATLSMFDALKSESVLILESSVEGEYFNLRFGYWGPGYGKYRYQSIVSGLSWREALNDFAKARALKWYKRKEEWTNSGKNPADFDKRYGAETVKRFMSNLEILEREQQCIEDGDDPNEIERPYSLHKQDYEELKRFIAACHCLAAGLLADEYYLADVPPENRCRPLFPELLPELLKSIPGQEASGLIELVVSYYRNIYEYLSQYESCWIPEISLDLAKSLTALPDKKWARDQVVYSVQKWLELHSLPKIYGADTKSVENRQNLLTLLNAVESALTVSDVAYIEKLNNCLEDIGESRLLNVADACFKRGMKRYKREEYETAISDFDQAVQLNSEWIEAYYNRGLAYARLKQYQEAVDDYTKVLNSDLEDFQQLESIAYNNRANAFYKLGEHEKAIADYDHALRINSDMPETDKNRAIVQGVLDEIIRREQGKEFNFETVTVDSKGNITDRKICTARQKIEYLDGVQLEMVYIPGGIFMMGSPESEQGRNSDEEPQHQVTISPFFMAKYPVTQKQWIEVMGNNPSSFVGADRPVENVSWNDAIEFCRKLSEKTRKNYRLPTESEWEYACRAGTTTPFYFGETITSDIVNYNGKHPYSFASKGKYCEETTDVGCFPPNYFGLCDMHGNVWEWCQDWKGSYSASAVTDPMGPSTGSARVLRGGSWAEDAMICRSAYCNGSSPGTQTFGYGFRLVLLPQVSR